jgi:hypothetical protein
MPFRKALKTIEAPTFPARRFMSLIDLYLSRSLASRSANPFGQRLSARPYNISFYIGLDRRDDGTDAPAQLVGNLR